MSVKITSLIVVPALPAEIESNLGNLLEMFNVNAVCNWTAQMETDVATAPLAQRFSKTKPAGNGLPLPGDTNPMLKSAKTEEEYKRQQLLIQLRTLRNDFLSLYGRAKWIFLDFEMAKRDG